MGILLQDTRYGLRNLVQTLGFTVVAMLTLALGGRANATIFNETLLKRCRSPNLTA